jgi:hypothetical protein
MNGSAIGAQFGDDERHLLRHEPGNESNVAREPVQLGDDDRALTGLPRSEGGC